jgi:ATP-dependent helicase/nuclease subunit A
MAELTDEQHAALVTRGVSVALSAGAGCGKTHVLTRRFLSHLEPQRYGSPVESARLHQLVAITFTDAAAREMRSRIRGACYEQLKDVDLSPDEAAHWLRLLRQIDTARISTIHSFCTSLLRRYAVEVGLDSTFGVLDQGEADVVQSEAIDDLLRERLASQDELTINLAATFGLARLKQHLAALLRSRFQAGEEPWRSQTAQSIVDVWHDFYARKAWPLALKAIADAAPTDDLERLLTGGDVKIAKPAFVEARATLLDLLPRLKAGAIAPDELEELREAAKVQGKCSAKDWPTPPHYERYCNACKAARDAIDANRLPSFDHDLALESAQLGLDLLELASAVSHRYAGRKRAVGKLDFEDLLSQAHAVLTNPNHAALQRQVSADLTLVLVDEFQDTDRLQVELIKAICGEDFDGGRLFFVGDFKQSIYRFRGAQPGVFADLQNELPPRGRLALTENFRSQPAILHFVNALFHGEFGPHAAPLRPHREQKTTEPNVEFLWSASPGKRSKVKGAADAARRLEADWIARRLRALIDNAHSERPVVDQKTNTPRGVRPGDIAILFRALSDVQLYEEALRRYELDYYLVGGHAFYAQQEIFDVLNLLRSVASSADEISLAGVLRSPFFSLEDETLFWLVEQSRELGTGDWGLGSKIGSVVPSPQRLAPSLNAGLLADKVPEELSEVERAKVLHAAATIRHLREIKDRVPIATLLHEALARTGYDAVLLAEFLGRRKLANLQKLIERARAADYGGTLALDGFITQLSQFIAHQPKEALAATSAETADVIRLMTIHQAKGLEFPLVVVPDLDRPPKLNPPPAALDETLGPVVALPADEEREKTATGMSLFAARERMDELEERKRLLYVACTRAADYLILSSSLESCDSPKSDWMRLIASKFDLASGQPTHELPPGYAAPKVAVTPEPPATDQLPAGKSRGPNLIHLLESARQLAAAGQAVVPPHVGPIPVDRASRRQFSFSRLTGQLVRAEKVLAPNDDVEGDESQPAIDPRGLGTLVHDVLERLPIDPQLPAGEINFWCEHLAPLHVEKYEGEAATLASDIIERLFKSSRGRRIAQAAEVHREIEFLLAWPPGGKAEHPAANVAENGLPPRYLRGYIDCLYRDEHGWRLVDYKTKEVTPAACPRVALQYEMQLSVYAMAAEQSLGVSPVELTVCFLRPGVEHTFAWNDQARDRAINMVNAAIHELISLHPASNI